MVDQNQRIRPSGLNLGTRDWGTGCYLEGLLVDFEPEGGSPGMCTCVRLSMSLRACFSASACSYSANVSLICLYLSLFGVPSEPLSGARSDPLSGALSDPLFGAPSDPHFGALSDPLFGALSDPLFGAPSEPPTQTARKFRIK